MNTLISSLALSFTDLKAINNKIKKIPPYYIALGVIAATGVFISAYLYFRRKSLSNTKSTFENPQDIFTHLSRPNSKKSEHGDSEKDTSALYSQRMQILLQHKNSRPEAIKSLKKQLDSQAFTFEMTSLYVLIFPYLNPEEKREKIFDPWVKAIKLESEELFSYENNMKKSVELWGLFLKEDDLKKEAILFKDQFLKEGLAPRDSFQELFKDSDEKSIELSLQDFCYALNRFCKVNWDNLAYLYKQTTPKVKDYIFTRFNADYFHFHLAPCIEENYLLEKHKAAFINYANLDTRKYTSRYISEHNSRLNFLKYSFYIKGVENKSMIFARICDLQDEPTLIDLCLDSNFPLDQISRDSLEENYHQYHNLASAKKRIVRDDTLEVFISFAHSKKVMSLFKELVKEGYFKDSTKLANAHRLYPFLTQEVKKTLLDDEDDNRPSPILSLFHKDRITTYQPLVEKLAKSDTDQSLEFVEWCLPFFDEISPEDRLWLFKLFIQSLEKTNQSYFHAINLPRVKMFCTELVKYPEYQFAILELLLVSFDGPYIFTLLDCSILLKIFEDIYPKVMANQAITDNKRMALVDKAKQAFEPLLKSKDPNILLAIAKIFPILDITLLPYKAASSSNLIDLSSLEGPEENKKFALKTEDFEDLEDCYFEYWKKLLQDVSYRKPLVEEILEKANSVDDPGLKIELYSLVFPYLKKEEKDEIHLYWKGYSALDFSFNLWICLLSDPDYREEALKAYKNYPGKYNKNVECVKALYQCGAFDKDEYSLPVDSSIDLQVFLYEKDLQRDIIFSGCENKIEFVTSLGFEKLTTNHQHIFLERINSLPIEDFSSFKEDELIYLSSIENLTTDAKKKIFGTLITGKFYRSFRAHEDVELYISLKQNPNFPFEDHEINRFIESTHNDLVLLLLKRKLDLSETTKLLSSLEQPSSAYTSIKQIVSLAQEKKLTLIDRKGKIIHPELAAYDPSLQDKVFQQCQRAIDRDISAYIYEDTAQIILAIFKDKDAEKINLFDFIKKPIFFPCPEIASCNYFFKSLKKNLLNLHGRYLLTKKLSIHDLFFFATIVRDKAQFLEFFLDNLTSSELRMLLKESPGGLNEEFIHLFEQVKNLDAEKHKALLKKLKTLVNPLLKSKDQEIQKHAVKLLGEVI